MFPIPLRWMPLALGMLFLGGCCYVVREEADSQVCHAAAMPTDSRVPEDEGRTPTATLDSYPTGSTSQVRPAAAQVLPPIGEPLPPPRQPIRTILQRLTIPRDLPGAEVPEIRLPSVKESPEKRTAAIRELFPPLPPLVSPPEPQPGPEGQPLTLADLQRLAMSFSPLLRQAAADVQAAKGAAIQAGAYPNPNFGYQSDTVGTSATAGFQGIFIEQTIKTGGKLKLQQAAAAMDLLNAETAFRRAQFDLVTAVRTNYYAVLVAQDTVKVSRALAQLSDETFRVQLDLLALGGQVAAYEPLALRVLAYQARAALVQARNRYTAAWKQLAATLGLPGMPPTQLAGRADMPIPVYPFDTSLARVLSSHTDVITAENNLHRARYNLRLAQVTPVPDISMHIAVEKDFSMPPFLVTHTLQIGGPIPLWDQNKGNIVQAQGMLLRAVEQPHQVRDDLTNRFTTAYEQYANNRVLIEYYRNQILPDQVRAYRALLQRFQQDPTVQFADLFTAQQTLAGAVTTYIATLGSLWTSVVGVADLMQIPELYVDGQEQALPPIPDLAQLAPLPCCHPCQRLPDARWKGADGSWPEATVGRNGP